MIVWYGKKTILILVLSISLLLTSCSQGARSGISIDIVSIEPPLAVGQVSTIKFALDSVDHNEIPDVAAAAQITQFYGPGEGEIIYLWEGGLEPDKPVYFSASICVSTSGTWRLDAGITEPQGLGDVEIRFIEADTNNVVVKINPPHVPAETEGHLESRSRAQELDELPFIDVSPECLEADIHY